MSGRNGVLLDTCAIIWFARGSPLSETAMDAILSAAGADGVFISPVSAWEIGLLGRADRVSAMTFLPDPKTWFGRILAAPNIMLAPFTPDIAIDASTLPEPLHNDPADRLLIATARHIGFPIVTRDPKIEAYAELGHVGMIRC